MKTFQLIIKVIVLLVFGVIWTVVGGAVWIQLLFRISMAFTAIMIVTLIGNSSSERPDLSEYFNYSTTFFFQGYRSAFKSLFPKNEQHKQSQYSPPDFDRPTFVRELLLTILFWLGAYFVMSGKLTSLFS